MKVNAKLGLMILMAGTILALNQSIRPERFSPRKLSNQITFNDLTTWNLINGLEVTTITKDFNNDGYDDLLLTQPQGRFNLYRNMQDGTFTTITFSPMVLDVNRVTNTQTYDIDLDGLTDLVYLFKDPLDGINARNQMYWSKNNGNFSFGTPQKFVTDLVVTAFDTGQPADVLDFIVEDFYDNGLPVVYFSYQRQSSPVISYGIERVGRRLNGTTFARTFGTVISSRLKQTLTRDFIGIGRQAPIFIYNASGMNQYTMNGLTSNANPTVSLVNDDQIAVYPLLNGLSLGSPSYSRSYQYLKGNSVATGDINQDGNMDFFLVGRRPNDAANPTSYVTTLSSHVSIPATGTRPFDNQLITTSLSQDVNALMTLATEDMNLDGYVDLIIAESIPTGPAVNYLNPQTMQAASYYPYSHTIKVWLNNQDGTFSLDPTTLASGTGSVSSLNRDNFLRNQNLNFHYTVSVENVNIQTGQYTNTLNVKAMNYRASAATVTLDEQGGSEVNDYFFGTRFAPDTTLASTGTKGIAIGDFDLNGTTDLDMPAGQIDEVTMTDLFKEGVTSYLALNRQAGTLTYQRSKRNGTFYSYPISDTLPGATFMKIADIDRDGNRDILIGNPSTSQVDLLSVVTPSLAPFTVSQSAGNQPIVVTYASGSVQLNGQTIASGASIPVSQETVLTFIHTLNDVQTRAFVFIVSMAFPTGPGTSTNQLIMSFPKFIRQGTPLITGYAGMTGLQTEDINRDARVDILLSNDAGEVTYYQASGSEGSFTPSTIQTGLSSINHMVLSDLNQDAGVDILLTSTLDETTSVLFQDVSTRSFPSEVTIDDTLPNPRMVATADLTGDTFDDILILNDEGVYGFLTLPETQTFSSSIFLTEATSAIEKFVMVDYNLDYSIDMLLFSPSTNEIKRASGIRNALYINEDPILEGSTFTGWYTEEATTTSYEFNQSVNTDITLYAGYALATITVTYQTDGATVNNNPTTFDPNGETVTLDDPEKTGYVFLGWYDNEDFLGDTVTELNATDTEDVTLYALWEIETYAITYELNGGTNAAGNPATYTVEDTVTFLDPEAPEGKTFAGWYDNETFTGEPVTSLPEGSTGAVTLFAKFTNQTFTITYDVGDGENDEDNPGTYQVDTPTITLEAPTPVDGFTFAGWYDNPDFNGDPITEITIGSTGDLTLYAKYEAIGYSVTYNLNGGTNHPENPSSYTSDQATITLRDPTRLHYDFLGWFDNENFLGDPITTITENSLGAKTFYAKWTPTVNTITYELNGGTNSLYNPLTFTVESSPFILDEAALNGFNFIGWYTSPDFDPSEEVIEINATLAGQNLVLYANFDYINYPIFYELGGGANSELNPTNYNIDDTITLEAPTRFGYTFFGWYGNPQFSGDPIIQISAGSTGVVALYAKWETDDVEVSYTVFYVIDTQVTTEVVVENAFPVEVLTPTKPGFTFIHWLDVTGEIITPSTTAITENTLFIAVFTADELVTTYQVIYVVDTTITIELVEHGAGLSQIPLNPTKVGYTFDGWLVNGFLITDLSSLTISEDTTIVAQFTLDEVQITVDVYLVVDTTATMVTIPVNTSLTNPPANPTKTGFTFTGWSVAGVIIDLNTYLFSESTVVIATFTEDVNETPTTYLVQFVVGTTVVYSETVVASGMIQNPPEDPTQLNATFAGWMVAGDIIDLTTYIVEAHVVLIASFTLDDNPEPTQTYTVFYVVNGVITSEVVASGESPSTIPENPSMSGYTFVGWTLYGTLVDPSEITIVSDVVLLASFTADGPQVDPVMYLVQFVVGTSVINTQTIEVNGVVTNLPQDPSQVGFTFLGWYVNGQVVDVATYPITAATVFVAQFSEDGIDPEPTLYQVIYVVDTTVTSEVVEANGTLQSIPDNPSKTGYTFAGWLLDGTLVIPSELTITGDIIIIASFTLDTPTPTSYLVTYVVGTSVTTETVTAGGSLSAIPDQPSLLGMTFIAWRISNQNVDLTTYVVQAEVIIIAYFEPETDQQVNQYVVFYVIGAAVTSEQVNANGNPSQVPSQPTLSGHTFAGWSLNGVITDPTTVVVTADLVFVATFTVNEVNPGETFYQVMFIANTSVLFTFTVAEGAVVTNIPSDPTKLGYTFLGWFVEGILVADVSQYVINDDTIFIAGFTANEVDPGITTFTVSFVVGDDVIFTTTVNEGDTVATIPDNPSRDGYTFAGWVLNGQVVDISTLVIENDTVLIAQFTAIPVTTYLVLYVIDDQLIFEEVVAGGTLQNIPVNPTKVGYQFIGWMYQEAIINPQTLLINENVVLVAIFELVEEIDGRFDLEVNKDGHYEFTFVDGTATLNGEVYESGTKITAPGSYELIITFADGRVVTYGFTIEAVASPSPVFSWWLWALLFINFLIFAWWLLWLLAKQHRVQFVVETTSRQQTFRHRQVIKDLPYQPTELPEGFQGWMEQGQRIDLSQYEVNKDTVLIAQISPTNPLPNTDLRVNEPTFEESENEDFDLNDDASLTFSFTALGIDTFYQRLTDPLKVEFASMFMEHGSHVRLGTILYRDGFDNTNFFGQILKAMRPHRKGLSLDLMKAIHEEMLRLTAANPHEQTRVNSAMLVYYYFRRKEAGFLEETITRAYVDIQLHRDVLKTEGGFVFSYKRLAIALEKATRYQEAITIVEEALAKGYLDKTVGEYPKRLARIKRRLAKTSS